MSRICSERSRGDARLSGVNYIFRWLT